jgi:prevent-host-death family protein
MVKTNVADVKARLSEFLDRALAGERIIICRHNTPVAELRALEMLREEPRPVGRLPGRPSFEVSPAFFESLPDEELDLWDSGSAWGGERPARVPRGAEGTSAVRPQKRSRRSRS